VSARQRALHGCSLPLLPKAADGLQPAVALSAGTIGVNGGRGRGGRSGETVVVQGRAGAGDGEGFKNATPHRELQSRMRMLHCGF
jgi:hypothetical protein